MKWIPVWIPVSEPPEVGVRVLLYDEWNDDILSGKIIVRDKRKLWDVIGVYTYYPVGELPYTYWMQRPEPPKKPDA
jgi:hypothetical protein